MGEPDSGSPGWGRVSCVSAGSLDVLRTRTINFPPLIETG